MTNDIIDVVTVEEENKRKQELNSPQFKEWFRGLLKEIEVNLSFKKADGEIRNMRCTLNESLVPENKRPTGNSNRKVPEHSIAVFDLDIQEWRSFRYESIIEFSGELSNDYPMHPEPIIEKEET